MASIAVALWQGACRPLVWLLQGAGTVVAMTLVTAMTSVALAAAQPFAAPKAVAPVATTGAGGLAQVTLSLIVVLAAVFAAAWLVRRLRNFGRPGAGAIQILADVALGTKERAVLIQVGTQQLLIGVAPGRVSTLHALTESVQIDGSNPDPAAHASPPAQGAGGLGAGSRPDFKAILKRSLGL